jgi:anti-sigma regulatory factor (Ser/Thr protein kinase)
MTVTTIRRHRLGVVTRSYPGRASEIIEVRRFIGGVLADHPRVDDVTLIASELATNAVEWTKSGKPGGYFTLTVEVGRNGVRVAIEDCGGPAEFAPPSPDGEGGRGLSIVATLSDSWRVTGDRYGRTVTVELNGQKPRLASS